MIQNNHSFYLFGGAFLAGLKPRLEELGSVAGELLGISPLSHYAACGGAVKPWLPELDASLTQARAKYLVLDLQMAQRELLAAGGCYITGTDRELAALKRKELALVDPVLLPKEQVEEGMDALIALIRKHFSADRILLIHTNQPPYWVERNNLRAELSPAGTPEQIQWLEDLEQRFREKTGCRFVDVTRFYFYCKEVGRPLTDMVFEEACYQDVVGRIRDILSGGDGKADRPDFGLSLDRYANYYFTLQRKPQRVFLDPGYFLDRLVLCADAEFVRRNRQELLELSRLDWHDPKETLALLARWGRDSELIRICKAFFAITRKSYKEPDVDYALLFRSGVAPDMLIADLQETYAPGAKLLPSQINRYNVGWHFARLTGQEPGAYSTEETVPRPTVVDIFGSCISRTPFNVKDNDFAVNRYWFHIVPFEHRNKRVDYPKDLFPAKLNWIDRLAKLQLDGGLYQDIKKSEAQWLVIDLYFLVGPYNYYYQDCIFGNFDHVTGKKLKAQRVNLFQDPSIFGTTDDLLRGLDPWLKLIRKKYGKRIILIDGRLTGPWIGDDDRIYQRKVGTATTEFLRRAAEYVRAATDCYRVDIGRHFLPDEAGYMRNTPSHMETLGYRATHDVIARIVETEPDQKEFTQYSGQIHLRHLDRLMENHSPAELEAVLDLCELDKAVIRLEPRELEPWREALIRLYSSRDWSCSLQEILAGEEAPELAELLHTASQRPGGAAATPEENFAPYPAGSVPANCSLAGGLPQLPKLKLKRLTNENGGITLQWAISAPAVVRVYRQCGESAWIQVARCAETQFHDTAIQPDTDYRYCICAELKLGEKRYLGNFTVPAAICAAPATPVLLGALHYGGENVLRWQSVPGAECYWVYRKDAPDQKWVRCGVVEGGKSCYREATRKPGGGEWYTVRALRTVSGKTLASGFQSGLQAAEL